MSPKTQLPSASKAAKLAKLELARKKAKQWAEDQKKLKARREKKSADSSNISIANDTSLKTRESNGNRSVSKKYSDKNKRKRAVESTDDDDSSTGPNGTPKVRKPIRKKVNKMTSPNLEYDKVKSKGSTSHSYQKRVYDSLDSDEEMTPIEKTTSKQSSSKLGKKEKLRLAREKAAKWAKNQKSPEGTTNKKSVRPSIDISSSSALNDVRRKSKSKIANHDIEMEIADRSSISRHTSIAKRSKQSKEDGNGDEIARTEVLSQNNSFTLNNEPLSSFGSTHMYSNRTPQIGQLSVSTSTQEPVLIQASGSGPLTEAGPELEPEPTPASLKQRFGTKPQIIPSPFARIEPSESSDRNLYEEHYDTDQRINPSKTNEISPITSDSFVHTEVSRTAMSVSNHDWNNTMPSMNDVGNQINSDASQITCMQEQSIPSHFTSKNEYLIRHRNEDKILDKKFDLEHEFQSNSQRSRSLSKHDALNKSKQSINKEQNEAHAIMKNAIYENKVTSIHNAKVMTSLAACKPTNENRNIEQKKEDIVVSTPEKETKSIDIVSLFCRVRNTVFHLCNIIVAFIFFCSCVALVYHLIDSSKIYWGQLLTKNKYNNMTRVAITTAPDLSISSTSALLPVEPENIIPPICFKSTIDVPDDDNIELPPNLHALGITSCRSDIDALSCPNGGICFGGYLQTCVPADILAVSAKHDACELTERGNEVLVEIKEKLIQLTLEQTCGCLVTSSSTQNTSYCLLEKVRTINLEENDEGNLELPLPIMFDIESFCEAINIPYYVISSMTSYWENNDVLLKQNPKATSRYTSIGLSPSFLQSKLPIPMFCYMNILLTSMLSFFLSTLYIIASTMFKYFFHFSKIYPIPTIVLVFTWGLCTGIRNKRRKNHGLRKKTREIREMAYKKLKLRGEKKYGEKHLRDDIAHELYPDSLNLRRKFMADIWPRVLVEVRCDSRVRRGLSNGMEWWEWADRGAQ